MPRFFKILLSASSLFLFVSFFFVAHFFSPQKNLYGYGDLLRLIYQIHPKTKSHFDMLTRNEFSNLEKDFKEIKDNNKTIDKNIIVPAVVIDVDATILNNINYSVWQVIGNHGFKLEEFGKFVKDRKAKIFAGVDDFIKKVKEEHGIVFFVSNRLGEWEGDTYANLIDTKEENSVSEADVNCRYQWFFQESSLGSEVLDRPEIKEQIENNQGEKNYKIDFKSKEDRFYVIDNLKLDNSSDNKKMRENSCSFLNEINVKKKKKEFKPQIVMRIGDDITDFNDNFFQQKNANVKHFLEDDDVLNNFGSDVNKTKKFFYLKDNQNNFKKLVVKNEKEYYRQVKFFSNLDYGTVRQTLESEFPNYDSAKKWLEDWYAKQYPEFKN